MRVRSLFAGLVLILIACMVYVVYISQKPEVKPLPSEKAYSTIGILSLSTNPSHEEMVTAIKGEIEKAQMKVTFVQENIQDVKEFPAAAKKLIESNVDLIIANGTPAVKAAADATTTIPVVFGGVGDPVANGIVKSLDSSGTNVTGVSSLSVELTAKRLEIFHGLFPTINKIYFIHQPNDIGSDNSKRKIEAVANEMNITLVEKPIHSVQEAIDACGMLRKSEAGAVMLSASGQVWSGQNCYISAQMRERIPVVGVDNLMAENGAIFSYGPNYTLMGIQLSKIVIQVLQGTPSQYIPIQRPQKVELIINKKASDQIGLGYTHNQLMSADRVIY